MADEEHGEAHKAAEADVAAAPIDFAHFLENVPPSQAVVVADLFSRRRRPGHADFIEITKPELQLHCSTDACNGPRFFRFEGGDVGLVSPGTSKRTFVSYICSNCQKTRKVYALRVTQTNGTDLHGIAFKFGEAPAYGPPTPTRLLRLFGQDREIFLKGRRCENQGLGIGAFSYYRRVVENHKNQLLDEIQRVAEKNGAPKEMIDSLEAARKEIQFSKAMTSVKNAIPQSLLINGQNPLTLLHSALSIGLHDASDEDCLERAHDVRVILAELADRIGQALKDEAELNTAVSRLMQAKTQKDT